MFSATSQHTSEGDLSQISILTQKKPVIKHYRSLTSLVLLQYPKPTPKPRFFAKTVPHRNLGISAIINGFWAHLHAKII